MWLDILSSSNGALDYSLKIVLGGFNVEGNSLLLDVGIADNDPDVSWRCELIDEGSEFLIAHDHGLELEACLNAAKFELLNDIADFLEAMDVLVFLCIVMGYYEESWPFKKYDLIRIKGIAKLLKVFF